ncbi:hypothetical protein Tco_1164583 [Tanacetum coccineum]
MLSAAEKPESPFDTESEIKIIKRFQLSQPDDDTQITFLGAEPYNQTKSTDGDSDSRLHSMPDDDLSKSRYARDEVVLTSLHHFLKDPGFRALWRLRDPFVELCCVERDIYIIPGWTLMATGIRGSNTALDLMNVEQALPVSEEKCSVLHD